MSKLKTRIIKATSRASVQIKGSYYTFEYGLEKDVPEDISEGDLQEEKDILWDECNSEVDRQIEDIVNFINKR